MKEKHILLIVLIIAIIAVSFMLLTSFTKSPDTIGYAIGSKYHPNIELKDSDGDGLKDFREEVIGTDPSDSDSDNDGLLDSEEISYNTNPLNDDSDDDALSDGDEVKTYGSDPLNENSDDDCYSDYEEAIEYNTDPSDEDDYLHTLFATAIDGYIYALKADDGSLLWTASTELSSAKTHYTITSSPAVDNCVVYFGGNDDYVYALNIKDGSEVWKHYIGSAIFSSPVIEDGVLYIGSHDKYVYALDADDGSELWSFETGDYIFGKGTVYNGILYIGSNDYYIYALDADDGTERWSFKTDYKVRATPAVESFTEPISIFDETRIPLLNIYMYELSLDDSLYALNGYDGTEEWSMSLGTAQMIQSAVVEHGVLYIGSYDGYVYALDAEDGSKIWDHKTEGHVIGTPTVSDGTLYISDEAYYVYAIDTSTGTRVWRSGPYSYYKFNHPPQVSDSLVFVNSYYNDKIMALDKSTGIGKWVFTTGDDMYSALAYN